MPVDKGRFPPVLHLPVAASHPGACSWKREAARTGLIHDGRVEVPRPTLTWGAPRWTMTFPSIFSEVSPRSASCLLYSVASVALCGTPLTARFTDVVSAMTRRATHGHSQDPCVRGDTTKPYMERDVILPGTARSEPGTRVVPDKSRTAASSPLGFSNGGGRRPQLKKVSARGTSDALFKECLDAIRGIRHRIAPDIDNESSGAVEKLSQQEAEIVRGVLQRVDPDKQIAPQLENRSEYIDPYWDPFQTNKALKLQISHELGTLSRLVPAAEARQQRLLIRQSLRRQAAVHDPLSREHMLHHGKEERKEHPVPKDRHERFWNPGAASRAVLRNNGRPISWRDMHLLHNFVGENGLVLPRRLTHASRYQQRCIFKAICIARRMALFPYDWKPPERDRMPVMDPLQYLVDELTQRYVGHGDRRARAMLMVMAARYTDLSFRRFFGYEGTKNGSSQKFKNSDAGKGCFTNFLKKYQASA